MALYLSLTLVKYEQEVKCGINFVGPTPWMGKQLSIAGA